MREGQGYVRGTTGAKRSVCVNGVKCESMAAGAREATRQLGKQICLWEIQRILKGEKKIEGLDVKP